MINELPLYMTSLESAPGTVDFVRTSCYYACLTAIRASLLNFFTFPTASLFAFPMSMHLHFSYCTHILYRLYLIDDPAFDRSHITRTVDLLGGSSKRQRNAGSRTAGAPSIRSFLNLSNKDRGNRVLPAHNEKEDADPAQRTTADDGGEELADAAAASEFPWKLL